MKRLNLFFASCAALLGATLGANAHAQAAADPGKMEGRQMNPATAPIQMTDAEVRKVDLEARKLTLQHGEIKNPGKAQWAIADGEFGGNTDVAMQ